MSLALALLQRGDMRKGYTIVRLYPIKSDSHCIFAQNKISICGTSPTFAGLKNEASKLGSS